MPIFTRDGRAVLFIHVPKTGGSSLERQMRSAGWAIHQHDGRMRRGNPNYYRWCTPQHLHGEILRSTFRLDRFDAIFVVVRDPIDRFRSEYVMRHEKGVSLEAEAVDAWATEQFRRYPNEPYILDNHFRPQAEFLVSDAVIYKLEDGLDAAVLDLNSRFDLGLSNDLGRERASERVAGVRSRDVEVSTALRSRLEHFYAEDYKAFGYVRSTQPGSGPRTAERLRKWASRYVSGKREDSDG